MKYRKLGFLLVLMPGLAMAQERAGVATGSSVSAPAATSPLSLGELPSPAQAGGPGVRANATTLAVLLANLPKDPANPGQAMPEADWLRLMEKPENATLYPLRVTQAMLDTLDATKLDLRYHYVLVKQEEMSRLGGR